MRTQPSVGSAKFTDLRHAAAWYLLTLPFVPGDPPGRLLRG